MKSSEPMLSVSLIAYQLVRLTWFPESLAEFFVLSFSPPGGKVCDCFGGSFTTAAVAVRHGRHFVGCDIRESQCEIGRKRIAAETPLGLFNH